MDKKEISCETCYFQRTARVFNNKSWVAEMEWFCSHPNVKDETGGKTIINKKTPDWCPKYKLNIDK